MLTEEIKKQNAEKYVELLGLVGLNTDEFINYLTSVAFFDAPYTAQYAGSYDGGLCEYSLKLAHELGILCNAYFPGKYTAEDILKVALFKEIYRATMYEAYNKNVKNEETGSWEVITAYRTKEERPVFGDLGFSSYMIMKDFTSFTNEQIEAIIHSTGVSNYSVDIHNILKEYKLVTLTRMADMAVANF